MKYSIIETPRNQALAVEKHTETVDKEIRTLHVLKKAILFGESSDSTNTKKCAFLPLMHY